MLEPQYFEAINITVPEQRIFRRLGYLQGKTRLSSKQKKQVEQYILDALAIIKLKGVARRFEINKKGEEKIYLSKNIVFNSRQLSDFIGSCKEIVLIAATAGNAIMKAIKKEASGRNITRGVVFDAVASEMTDAALDWIMSYLNQQLRRENKQLTKKRYSCGYGDFLLENQKRIYKLLNLKQFKIEITKSFILMPEKSVTAIAGVREV